MKRTCIYAALLLTLYLGLHNGHLALYRDTPEQIIHTFPYNVRVYPHVDQQALERGIPIGSREDLARLVEDYMS